MFMHPSHAQSAVCLDLTLPRASNGCHSFFDSLVIFGLGSEADLGDPYATLYPNSSWIEPFKI
jgi:hypothetical protein